MRIVNWNLEWATSRSRRGRVLRQRIMAAQPQIVSLTEAYLDFLPDEGYVIAAEADAGYPLVEGRRKVLLWSKRPWQQTSTAAAEDMPPGRYVFGLTDTTLGPVGVHGVCIPWAHAHVSSGQRNRNVWEDHLHYLQALGRLISTPRPFPQIIVGDFNQRIPRKYTPHAVHNALLATLDEFYLVVTTGTVQPAGEQTIDHIACDARLKAVEMGSITQIGEDGQELSDHFGVTAVLALAP